MGWVSTMGRRFLQAYSEGLTMTCPMHRAEAMPAAIDRLQDNVEVTLRPEFAGNPELATALGIPGAKPVRH